MSEASDNTSVVDHLRLGETAAQQKIWKSYFQRLTALARAALRRRGGRMRVADEEDVVLSVFDTVFQRAERGEFPNLNKKDDLWRLLLAVTKRKVANQVRNESAQKRGGGHVRGDSAFAAEDTGNPGIDAVVGQSPTGTDAHALVTCMEELLESVDEDLQKIAVLRLQGYKNTEIAERLGCSRATVERRMASIREFLCQSASD
jgi:RNA polymerase sigma factor (sigma-70 family)